MRYSEPNIDTASLIFDHYFLCRMPTLQATSYEYMQRYGTYTTRHKGIDEEVAKQWLTTMAPISDMVDHFKNGTQIKIVKYEDTKIIYEHITAHLTAWKERLTYGLNIGTAPVEDLIAMDQFANSVYEHAKYQFTEETLNSILANSLSSTMSINKFNIFKKPLVEDSVVDADGLVRINSKEKNLPERESLSDFLKARIVGLVRA